MCVYANVYAYARVSRKDWIIMLEDLAKMAGEAENCALELYKDLAQPSARVIGNALGTTLEFLVTPFTWLQLPNGKTKINIQHRLQQYADQLQQVPQEKQCEVHPELGVPIMQRLAYTTNDDVAELFLDLLTSASNLDKVSLAHPSFIAIIDRLSPDEAKLLKYIAENEGNVLYVDFRAKRLKEKNETLNKFDFDTSYIELEKWHTLVARDLDLDFPDNLHMYWANLISCGLLIDGGELGFTDMDEKYNEIAEYNKIVEVREENVPMKYREIQVHNSYFQITALGAQFLDVCVLNNTESSMIN